MASSVLAAVKLKGFLATALSLLFLFFTRVCDGCFSLVSLSLLGVRRLLSESRETSLLGAGHPLDTEFKGGPGTRLIS